MVRLTDRPDMTLDVYRGRKTTMQQQCGRDVINRIYHRSPMQTGLHRGPMFDYFSTYDIKSYYLSFIISFFFDILCRIMTVILCFSAGAHVTSPLKFTVLTSPLT